MSSKLTTSIALTALLSVLAAAPVLAQQAAPEAPAQSAPQEAPAATVTLPQALQEAGLTDVTSSPMRRGGGTRINGTLPDGTKIGAFVDASGALRGLRGQDDAALPAALVEALVPQNIRENPIYDQLGQLRGIFVNQDGIMLAGADAQDNRVRAAFSQDGTLIRFGRGEGGMRRGFGEHRDKAEGRRGWKGDKGDRDRRGFRQERWEERQGFRAIDEAALRQSLTDGGYSDVGTITRMGPRIAVEAVNPEGEAVSVELDPKGEVLREINR